MSSYDPVELLFGGMEKLGPGGNVHTLHVLGLLPKQNFDLAVDVGCGSGRQTLALARELRTLVHAVDSYERFLSDLSQRAKEIGMERLVKTHCMDMKDIPQVFEHIDLLWSEGAAYNIGFRNALSIWASCLAPEGFAVISEMSWLKEQVPDVVRKYFRAGYPDMRSIDENIAAAQSAGYKVIGTHLLPEEAWVEDYYDVLEPRAKALVDHPDPSVREFAIETVREIEVFQLSENSYGYVFYLLQRT